MPPTWSMPRGRTVPGVSQGALQMGRYVAHAHRRARCAAATRAPRRLSLPRLRRDGHRRQVARGGRDRPAALRRPARLARVDGAAHHGAHRLSQPPRGAVLLDLQLRVLPPRLAPDHRPHHAPRAAHAGERPDGRPPCIRRGRHSRSSAPAQDPTTLRGFFGVFRYSRRALELVWSTNRAPDAGAGRR